MQRTATQIPLSVNTFSLKYFSILKASFRWLTILLLLFLHMAVVQGIFFVKVISDFEYLEPADLVIAFQGNDDRTSAAYHLMDFLYAPVLVISPATLNQLEEYDQKYQPRMKFERILETKAKTTFENALYAKEIIEKNNYKNVILVTSWNHLPRSYLLLKMMLVGSDTRVQVCGVPTGKLDRKNWYKDAKGWKMVYNEMVETYGSFVQMANYLFDGKPPEIESDKSAFWGGLKKALLFKIETNTLG